MVSPLSNSTGTPVKWGQSSKTQKAEKTAKSAMTDGFVEQIKKRTQRKMPSGVFTCPRAIFRWNKRK